MIVIVDRVIEARQNNGKDSWNKRVMNKSARSPVCTWNRGKTRAPNVTKYACPVFLRPSIVIIGCASAKLRERTLLEQFWPFRGT